MNLTPKTMEVLRAVEAGQVHRRNFGHGAWRTVGANPSVVGRLVSAGLVRLEIFGDDTATLTAEGRAAIAKATGGRVDG